MAVTERAGCPPDRRYVGGWRSVSLGSSRERQVSYARGGGAERVWRELRRGKDTKDIMARTSVAAGTPVS